MKQLKVKQWLNGSFTCIKCKKLFRTMSFGFGEAICPECYQGEHTFLFLDENYLLNRIITRLQNHKHIGHERARSRSRVETDKIIGPGV